LDTIAFKTEILRVIDGDTVEIIYYDLFMRLRFFIHLAKRSHWPKGSNGKKWTINII